MLQRVVNQCITGKFNFFSSTKNPSQLLSGRKPNLNFGRKFSVNGIEKNPFFPYQINSVTKQLTTAGFSKKYTKAELAEFNLSNCMVTLSLGQRVHTGPELAATMHLVNAHFKLCQLVLGDTLQRFTRRLTSLENEETLHENMKTLGDEWLASNINTLSKMSIPWKIIRWDTWLKDPRFPKYLQKIKSAYDLEPHFRQVFDKNIQDYLARVQKRGEKLTVSAEKARELCLAYLQEECAAMFLWVEENCQFELYAMGRGDALQVTYERFIEPLRSDLLRPISLKFFNNVISYREEEPQVKRSEGILMEGKHEVTSYFCR